MKRLSLLLFALLGCQKAPQDLASTCAPFVGQYAIEYVGGAIGKGELKLSLPSGRSDILEGRLVLFDETGTKARLELFGPATCDQELVHLTFGAGDHPDAKVRVLGGVGTIVPAHRRVGTMFGVWEVTAFIKETEKTQRLKGFLKEKEPEAS